MELEGFHRKLLRDFEAYKVDRINEVSNVSL
jgi:hypothetical protein